MEYFCYLICYLQNTVYICSMILVCKRPKIRIKL
nr:MAG TPA: hypothetical protein [Caudoviricetes sp.]